VIAAIIIVAGVYIFSFAARSGRALRDGHGAADLPLLLAVGAASGFGSACRRGRTAVLRAADGDPGFVPLAAVGASQVLQIVAALSGSAAACRMAASTSASRPGFIGFELAGLVAGVRLAHALSANVLRRMAAALCVAVGTFMLVRAL